MRKTMPSAGLLAVVLLSHASAAQPQMPSFLPAYYAPAFDIGPGVLRFIRREEDKGVERYIYATADDTLGLFVENIPCDRPRSEALYSNILFHINGEIKTKQGEFRVVNSTEFHAQIRDATVEKAIFTYVTPTSIQSWTHAFRRSGDRERIAARFDSIKTMVDRQRYDDSQASSLFVSLWESAVYEHAHALLRTGKKEEAIAVLRNLVAACPFNYRAHVDLLENTSDAALAANSAQIVFRNAEDAELVDKAARYLGKPAMTLDSIPLLDQDEKGLQLILIPLAPCDPRLLGEAAETYRKITDIPVKIRRLTESWQLAAPERIGLQRPAQTALLKMKGGDVNFTGWSKQRYIKELREAVESQDALSKHLVKELIAKINTQPGQYLADPHVDWLSRVLEKYRSADRRTMYVGITEVNIYSGDTNYVFSSFIDRRTSPASILSYHMMQAEPVSQEHQSRQRLVERIAKELVPASLKTLDIPRSTDPMCPYSFSSGIERLDQKTLTLSDPVKQALEKFRAQP